MTPGSDVAAVLDYEAPQVRVLGSLAGVTAVKDYNAADGMTDGFGTPIGGDVTS